MIPVVGVPHLNHPELLATMLDSIDAEVGRLIIVDNATTEADGAPDRDGAEIVQPGWNLGVAASWNLVLKVAPDSPWWALVNNDVEFAPGDLARLADFMDAAHGPAIGMLVEFGAFAFNRAALARLGYFDENYAPIYAEDADWRRRADLAGVPAVALESRTRHAGSMCFRDGPRMRDNERTYPRNVDYHVRKWGGPPWHEVYTSPFDAGGDLRTWTLDPERLREQAWE